MTTTKDHRDGEWFDEADGQLALDVFQTDDTVILKAPIAGVMKDDLEVSVTDEVVTIKGSRHEDVPVNREGYFLQECYWGSFGRSYVLPVAVDADRAQAALKDGMLTITIPKLEKTKARLIAIQDASN